MTDVVTVFVKMDSHGALIQTPVFKFQAVVLLTTLADNASPSRLDSPGVN